MISLFLSLLGYLQFPKIWQKTQHAILLATFFGLAEFIRWITGHALVCLLALDFIYFKLSEQARLCLSFTFGVSLSITTVRIRAFNFSSCTIAFGDGQQGRLSHLVNHFFFEVDWPILISTCIVHDHFG